MPHLKCGVKGLTLSHLQVNFLKNRTCLKKITCPYILYIHFYFLDAVLTPRRCFFNKNGLFKVITLMISTKLKYIFNSFKFLIHYISQVYNYFFNHLLTTIFRVIITLLKSMVKNENSFFALQIVV